VAPGFFILVGLLIVAQLALPKHLGFLPLVIAGLHLGNREILPELTTARLLVLLGLLRAISGGYMVWPSFKSRLDVLLLLFCFFALLSTIGHKADQWIPSPFNARAGLVLNVLGTYLYGRTYLPDIEAFKRYVFLLPMVLVPLAILMTIEKRTERNFYFAMGGIKEESVIREDKVRAVGPFRHPILAGTAGATVIPFGFMLWYMGRKRVALVAFVACLGVTVASASSGPLAAVAVSVVALGFWRWRQYLRHVVWGGLLLALLYNLINGRGPWYIMASLDLVGGSTGWHRAKLIDQGFVYLGDWWLFGTDYTRNWMASGVRWNPNMVDLTNYYLHLGVTGGLALTLCLIGFIVVGFKLLTSRMAELKANADPDEFMLWCVGASLAAHAISFVSISYFDQMYIYFYLLLAAIPGLVSTPSSLSALKPSLPSPAAEPIPVKPLRYYS
jgi:hypothetical protein